MKFQLLFAVSLLLMNASFAQIDWQELKMGSSAKNWENKLTNISNPNSWEETAFVLNEKHSFFGLESEKVELSFYNDRLYGWKMLFDAKHWNSLRDILTSKIDANGKIDETKKEGYWYGEGAKKQFAVFTSNNQMTLYFTDQDPKEFHWQDLFSGSLLYVFGGIVGGVALWYLVAWLWVSYCPQCHSFTMEHIKRESKTRFRQDPNKNLVEDIFSSDPGEMYLKTKDYYKCKKCGHESSYKGKSK